MASQTQRLLRRITSYGLFPLCLVGLASAQRPVAPPTQNAVGPAAINLDASRLDHILTLPGPFPTRTLDDPTFARSDFNDFA